MEINQAYIDALEVNEVALMKGIAEGLNLTLGQVSAVIGLFAEGSTIPFIARYRKEKTGNLDEVQLRDIDRLFSRGKNLETRRIEIIRGIFDQGKLTEALADIVNKAQGLAELEDLYTPYRKKKKTRGMLAIEKGLEPLAEAMLVLDAPALLHRAADFIRENTEEPSLAVLTPEEALEGARDILAERIAMDPENRRAVKAFYTQDGRIIVKGIGDEETKKTSRYQMYWDYTEKLSQIKPHRILAINRGDREGALETTIDVDESGALEVLQKKYLLHNEYHKTAVEDGLKRLLSPAVLREIRGDQGEAADHHGISVFSQNLKNLLMQQPLKGTRVLGIDPGIRTGTKCAALDDTGKYLHHFVIYNHKTEEAKQSILQEIKQYNLQLLAIGNGTGSREVQDLVAQVIGENNLEILYTVVDEDGASVYSASDIAREEFPDLDLTIRGAISIGRRLQDPLAELVKIDPKSIGVGLYQHDVNQKKLSETLDEVVSSVVNNVGVNLNTASASLLRYVSGITSSLAKKIVKYREEKGKIASRQELIEIPGLGPKTFEQCAGFLKIPESGDPLDNTWVHPENYEVARSIQNTITTTGSLSSGDVQILREKHGIGDGTIQDIAEELKKPNRDPREGYPKPLMQKGVVTFEDLKEGMKITGKIKNVVDFGAFVDLGIKETALIHISEISERFVKDPLDALKVGEVLEFRVLHLDQDRRRIALSRRPPRISSPGPFSTPQVPPPTQAGDPAPQTGGGPGAQFSGIRPESPAESRESPGTPRRIIPVRREGTAPAPARPPRAGKFHAPGFRPDKFQARELKTPGASLPEEAPREQSLVGETRSAGNSAPAPREQSPEEARSAGNRPGGSPAPEARFPANRRPEQEDQWSRYLQNKPQPEDDGTMYNAFAEAFKKAEAAKKT
ncbi:MAG: helix-hairpin-helix domain-containing protein, partial [Spirochaetaceae bacterium]|nr:helix-hairpin-helix domain-containing protein [Spirochaetaceae bacterium]